jgi:hypothetical protein
MFFYLNQVNELLLSYSFSLTPLTTKTETRLGLFYAKFELSLFDLRATRLTREF